MGLNYCTYAGFSEVSELEPYYSVYSFSFGVQATQTSAFNTAN